MSKKFKAALAGLAFVAGCEVGIALQLMKMIREYTVKEKALNEPLEASEEEIAAEQAINEELDTREQKAPPSPTERRTLYGIQDHRRFKL